MAEREVRKAAAGRSWVFRLQNSSFTQDLYTLACETRGVDSMTDADILPTFFTPEAVATLMSLPNLYWFWHIVRRALTHDEDLNGTLVDSKAVSSAICEERRVHARAFDLSKSIGQLSREELAAWAAAGTILVTPTGPDFQLIRNPIFSLPAAEL